MELKTTHVAAKEQVARLIHSGNDLLKELDCDYNAKRKCGRFDPDKDIPRYNKRYIEWIRKALEELQAIFPTTVEVIRVKNARASALVQSGMNMRYSGIRNTIFAKIQVLDALFRSLEQDGVPVLADKTTQRETTIPVGSPLRQIAEELRDSAASKKGAEVMNLISILAKQLARIDPEDFLPDAQVEFLKLRHSLQGWVRISLGPGAYGAINELADKIVCILDRMRASETAAAMPTQGIVSDRAPNYLEKCKTWAFSHKWLAVIIIPVLVLSFLVALLCGLLGIWGFLWGG